MFDQQLQFLQKRMDVSAVERKTIADNITNFNTPGFKASKVQFEHLFEKNKGVGLQTSNDKHISGHHNQNDVRLTKDLHSKERFDGNNVDLTQEMIGMVKNNHIFNTSVQALNKEFKLHKIAIGN